jgi:hypothetical protein
MKRTDVGYKRPPPEHQFKPGQKPPPRKPKSTAKRESARDLLNRLLNEPRRVLMDGKAVWRTTADLLVHKAYEAAEQGSPTIGRLLSDLHFADEPLGFLPPEERYYVRDGDTLIPMGNEEAD